MNEIVAILAPVFLCAGVGFGWLRLGQPYDRTLVTRLIADVGAPCLVFTHLVDLAVEPRAFASMAGAALLSMLAFALLPFLLRYVLAEGPL